MSDVFSIGEVALINAMDKMNVISQNVANSNTYGYKTNIAFSEVLQSESQSLFSGLQNNGVGTISEFSNVQSLPRVVTVQDFSPGSVARTDSPLDIAIQGDGFFVLQTNEGVRYSRNGAFELNAMGRLVDANGFEVQGVSGGIRLQSSNVKIDQMGVIYENDEPIAQIKIVDVKNPEQLVATGGNLYQQGGASISQLTDGINVRQGHLEASNVNAMKSMVDMMSTLRQVEITQKVIKSYDEVLGTAINSLVDF